MDLFTTLATLAGVVTWWIHTFLGHRYVYKRLLQADMNEFTRAVLIACWHATTYILGMMVIGLIFACQLPGTVAREVTLALGALLTLPFALIFIGIGKWRFGRFWVMPQLYLLGTVGLIQVLALALPVALEPKVGLGLVLGLVLFALALLHVLWAQGLSWPAKSRPELTELVVGQPATSRFPAKSSTWLVALFLAMAGGGVVAFSMLQQPPRWTILLMGSLAVIFLLRGLGGYFDHRLRPWTRNLPFGHWNRVLYSPVSLVMGFLAWALASGVS